MGKAGVDGVEAICCDAAIHLYSMSLFQSESIRLSRSFGVGLRHRRASASMLRRSNLELKPSVSVGPSVLAASSSALRADGQVYRGENPCLPTA